MTGRRFVAGADGRLALGAADRASFDEALRLCDAGRVAERVWDGDHTLWKPGPTEIANRLGWLRAPAAMAPALPGIAAFAEEVRRDGVTDVLLLGMGGSSLAPELFARTFPAPPGFPAVAILDSTDPGAVLEAERRLDPARTLFVVSTKSGGTVETLSFFKYFHALAAARLGAGAAGRRFVAITDPGSSLEAKARDLGARRVFLADPDVGGRFSALTHFGMVPAALGGADAGRLLASAAAMASRCRGGTSAANPGAALGALLGGLALSGRDKLTLHASAPLASFGAWVEQLVAESTGKEGKGILPVAGETPGPLASYGEDRLFVFLLLAGDGSFDEALGELAAAGHPVLRLELRDRYDLGGEFFRWEMATAVAGHFLRVNPFDQPDVESAKVQANRALAAYREEGSLPVEPRTLTDGALSFSGDAAGTSAVEALRGFLDGGGPGAYVSVQAYLPPRPEIEETLSALQCVVRDRWRLAATAGFGPRFLHSTGQLHKGGPNTGLFVQVTADDPEDARIPDGFGGGRGGAVTFGVLKAAQALGDRRALLAAGRRVLHVHLGGDAAAGLREVLRILGGR